MNANFAKNAKMQGLFRLFVVFVTPHEANSTLTLRKTLRCDACFIFLKATFLCLVLIFVGLPS